MKKILLILVSLLLPLSASAQVFGLNQIASSTQAIPYFGVLMGDGFGTHKATASSSPTVASITATSTTLTSYFAGNVTINGTCTGCGSSGTVSTSSAETNTYIPFWTSTAGTPALLSGGSSNLTWDGTKLFANYASTTALTSTGSAYFATVSGNVGIGTTSPYSMLSVAGQIVGQNFVATSTTATSTFSGGLSVGNNAAFVVNQVATANSLYIASSGNVGIGTTTPGYPLDVVGSSISTIRVGSSGQKRMALEAGSGGSAFEYDSSGGFYISSVANASVGTGTGVLQFSINGAAPASSLVINNLGNVGIGTTTPGSLLSLGGIANFTSATSTFYGNGLNLTNGCFAVNGTCVGGGAGTNYFTNSGIYTYLSTGTNLGIGVSTPTAGLQVATTSSKALTVQDQYGDSGITALSVNTASTTGIYNLLQLASTSPSKTLFAFDTAGHIQASSTVPVLSSCGTTPTLSADSNDLYGTITVGSVSATACTLTFGTAHTTGTHCNITNQSSSVVNAMTYTESLSGFTVSMTALTGDLLDYACWGQ